MWCMNDSTFSLKLAEEFLIDAGHNCFLVKNWNWPKPN